MSYATDQRFICIAKYSCCMLCITLQVAGHRGTGKQPIMQHRPEHLQYDALMTDCALCM